MLKCKVMNPSVQYPGRQFGSSSHRACTDTSDSNQGFGYNSYKPNPAVGGDDQWRPSTWSVNLEAFRWIFGHKFIHRLGSGRDMVSLSTKDHIRTQGSRASWVTDIILGELSQTRPADGNFHVQPSHDKRIAIKSYVKLIVVWQFFYQHLGAIICISKSICAFPYRLV